ncbi:LacI family DNA-binding transcriptional regulator [Paraburkholderia sp. BCC1886]|uniref:LacI family DNA-binding transcriptional regulator n=1 Tax=Paraburkholderia sp. BCC1886 TaxID=2562670 RepID=UPI0011840966|nr:LacI family DNA-binding transcriptional regulator [Paraburkholderia sp. BCC1886]
METRFATLKDVAQAAGTSTSHVSRALRGDPGVNPDMRARVKAAAESLGYRPNIAAQMLVSAQSSTVGIVVGEPLNPFHLQMAISVDQALERSGFESVISLRATDDRAATAEASRLLRIRMGGAIFIGTPRKTRAMGQIAQQLPCVFLGRGGAEKHVATVDVDNESGVKQAVEHLIALGHRRIAHIGGSEEIAAKERTTAYKEAMLAAGLKPNVYLGAHDRVTGRLGAEALMAGTTKPTALFAANDAVAMGAMDRLHGLGYRVPEDVSIIGFDDIEEAASETISLSTIRQNTDDAAREAVTSLRMLAFESPPVVRKILMPVSLVLRRSVAPRVGRR